ncbi:uncharacterized protein LOC119673029 [Teleopsis dalmanni]|uniref:uncharacterized protein LOC119673029 n=1 Tax=Teleopsis dalmanni TaxID=139649 RepID=UPI0018CF135F|nr:uncharacterized protein LOC119673029 [Teleopsis dalmanni]
MTSEKEVCRICHQVKGVKHIMCTPCKCVDEEKYVHEDCLIQMIADTDQLYCKKCNFIYKLKINFLSPWKKLLLLFLHYLKSLSNYGTVLLIKAIVLIVLQYVVVPLLCGFFVCVSTVSMHGSSLTQMRNAYKSSPIKTIGKFYLIGALYVVCLWVTLFHLQRVVHPVLLAKIMRFPCMEYFFDKKLFQIPRGQCPFYALNLVMFTCSAVLLQLMVPLKLLSLMNLMKFIHYNDLLWLRAMIYGIIYVGLITLVIPRCCTYILCKLELNEYVLPINSTNQLSELRLEWNMITDLIERYFHSPDVATNTAVPTLKITPLVLGRLLLLLLCLLTSIVAGSLLLFLGEILILNITSIILFWIPGTVEVYLILLVLYCNDFHNQIYVLNWRDIIVYNVDRIFAYSIFCFSYYLVTLIYHQTTFMIYSEVGFDENKIRDFGFLLYGILHVPDARSAIKRVFSEELHKFNINSVIIEICVPVACFLIELYLSSLALYQIVPLIVQDFYLQFYVIRYMHFFIFLSTLAPAANKFIRYLLRCYTTHYERNKMKYFIAEVHFANINEAEADGKVNQAGDIMALAAAPENVLVEFLSSCF